MGDARPQWKVEDVGIRLQSLKRALAFAALLFAATPLTALAQPVWRAVGWKRSKASFGFRESILVDMNSITRKGDLVTFVSTTVTIDDLGQPITSTGIVPDLRHRKWKLTDINGTWVHAANCKTKQRVHTADLDVVNGKITVKEHAAWSPFAGTPGVHFFPGSPLHGLADAYNIACRK